MQRAPAISPVGSTAADASRRRADRSAEYRKQREERAALREIAWLLIRYRMDAGLSQQELAEPVGTSHSQISRIESGRHRPNLETLQRIAAALDRGLVIGFEGVDDRGRTIRDLVTF